MFALFAGDHIVRTRRDEGLQGTHETLEGAKELLRDTRPNAAWAHVVDIDDASLPIVAVYGWGDEPRRWRAPTGGALSLEDLITRTGRR